MVTQPAPDETPSPGQPLRPDSLLPAESDPDGRFGIAEEVSLDQQSDEARRIGGLPPDPAPGADLDAALASTLPKPSPPA